MGVAGLTDSQVIVQCHALFSNYCPFYFVFCERRGTKPVHKGLYRLSNTEAGCIEVLTTFKKPVYGKSLEIHDSDGLISPTLYNRPQQGLPNLGLRLQ